LKLLNRRLKITNWCKLCPIHEGYFDQRSNKANTEQFFNEEGSFPLKLLFLKIKASILKRVPIENGIFPDNLLLLRSTYCNEVKLFQQSGNSPFNSLFAISKTSNMLGILVLHRKETKSEKLLLDRYSDTACDKKEGMKTFKLI
jgi:hypothetical protein